MISEKVTASVDNIKVYNGAVYIKLTCQNGYKWIHFGNTGCHTDYLVENEVIDDPNPPKKKTKKNK